MFHEPACRRKRMTRVAAVVCFDPAFGVST
jgi:hypothetical protein